VRPSTHRVVFFGVLVALNSFSSGCTTADLRPQGLVILPDTAADVTRARQLAERTRESQPSTRVKIRGRDVWSSTIMRWFTPLSSNNAEFVAEIDPATGDMKFSEVRASETLASWDLPGRARLHRARGESKNRPKGTSNLTAVYLDSFVLYLRLPWLIRSSDVLQLLPNHPDPETAPGLSKTHDAVFAMARDTNDDHYILWINRETGRLDFAEFTYRDLAKSYRGVLRFDGWFDASAGGLPRKVTIQSDFRGDGFAHRIEIDTSTLIGSP